MDKIIQAIKISALEIEQLLKNTDTVIKVEGTQNSSGDTPLELDIASDVIIEREFKKLTQVKSIMSEEKENEVVINQNGEYLIGYDPLDGSSLADVNLSVGSIFGIYKNNYHGNSLVASVYVVYGPRVEMVVATNKLEFYILNKDGTKEVTQLKLAPKGKLNAPGATQMYWYPHHKKMIDSLFMEGYRLRYSGGMVPDLHQILIKGGGLFSYPGTIDKPQGKLRMIFEVFPFAYIYEIAGGKAIDDSGVRLLDLKPSHLHDTTPCFFGSDYEIQKVKDAYGTT